MALAVCLLFDSRSERLVRDLWARLEDLGVGTLASHTHRRHHPHLSYAVLRSWDLDEVRDALSSLPDGGELEVSCHGALVFPRGRVALAPAVGAGIAARQEQVVAAVEATTGADLHRNYRAARWVPHVSVATRASATQIPWAVKAIADVVPLPLRATRAALVDSATGRLVPLPHVP